MSTSFSVDVNSLGSLKVMEEEVSRAIFRMYEELNGNQGVKNVQGVIE